MRGLVKTFLTLLFLAVSATSVFAANAFYEYTPPSNEQVYNKSTYKVNAIDPTLKK